MIDLLEKNGYTPEKVSETLELDGFDDACIGITSDMRLVYDYTEMVRIAMNDYEVDEIDAMDYLQFDLSFGTSYGKRPIIVHSLERE